MSVWLGCSVPGSEPWPIGDEIWQISLDDAIDEEADNIAGSAGSELLEEPTLECRDALKARIVSEMRAALRGPGDTYRDPSGGTYSLFERAD